jgi:hypothetical protein
MVKGLLFFAGTASLSALVVVAFLNRLVPLDGNEKCPFISMVYGTAYKPFVNRALVPLAIRGLTQSMPIGTRQAVKAWVRDSPTVENAFRICGWTARYAVEYLWAVIFVWASTIGFVYALRSLVKATSTGPKAYPNLVALASLFVLPGFFSYTYIYDLPQLFLFTLGLSLQARRRWGAYLPVFLLACLNKETSVLLLLAFLIHFRHQHRSPREKYLALGLAQLGLFVVTRVILGWMFAPNPGGLTENNLGRHLQFLLSPSSPAALVSGLVICVAVLARWSQKPMFLRDAAWIGVPLFVAFVPWGFEDEIRQFYEFLPIGLCLAAQTVALWMGYEVVGRDREVGAASAGPTSGHPTSS